VDFLYPFLNFFQPGILWPQLAPYKPMLLASILGVIAGIQASRHHVWSVLKRPALAWALAFAVIQALSLYYGGVSYMLWTFAAWYIFPMFMAISLLLMPTEASLRRYVWGMIFGAMVVVVYGIWAKFSGLNSIRVPGEYFMAGRAGAYGMYHNQNDYSFIIIQTFPFMYLYWRNAEKRLPRAFLLASLVTCVAGILLCLSRGGMLALVLEGFLLLVLTTRRRTQLLLLPLFAALAIGGIGYQWKMRAQNDEATNYTYAESEGTRLELWSAAGRMIATHPLLGVGSERFGEFAKYYYELSHDDLGKNAHNTYLDIAATSGLLGFGAFLMLLRSTYVELKVRSPNASKWLEGTRLAALIAFLSILFRAFMDAKEVDWSFYTLAAIAAATSVLIRRGAPAAAPAAIEPAESREGPEPTRRPRLIRLPWAAATNRSAEAPARPNLRSYRS
jgi:O-antigen ligase